jgi:glycosyltransferase involved in cell wall biosynthesis
VKILIANPCYYPAHRYGGPVKSVHEMARKLVQLGADITVFTTNADGSEDLKVTIEEPVDVDGVKVCYYPVEKPRSYFRSPDLASALQKRVSEFEIVHINWLYVYTTLVAARECIRQGVPYLLAPRGMLDPNAIRMHGNFKKNLYLNLIERKHLYGASAVHFTSFGERDQASSSGWNLKSIVVPNGIDLNEFEGKIKNNRLIERFPELAGKRTVLFLGRLNYIKGLDMLAEAWPLVVQEIPNAHLILAGPDENGYAEKVRGWLKKGGVHKQVTFTGMLLGEDKSAALSISDVFVASSYLESFGMAIVEAMACGKPVVITDRVNIHDEVKTAKAGLVTGCDSASIAQALIAVLKNPGLGLEMGLNGRRLAEEKFTWDIAARGMLGAYQQILDKII